VRILILKPLNSEGLRWLGGRSEGIVGVAAWGLKGGNGKYSNGFD
jgi:hypothetical protein